VVEASCVRLVFCTVPEQHFSCNSVTRICACIIIRVQNKQPICRDVHTIFAVAFTQSSSRQIIIRATASPLATGFATTFDEFSYCGVGRTRHLIGTYSPFSKFHLFSAVGGSSGQLAGEDYLQLKKMATDRGCRRCCRREWSLAAANFKKVC